MLNIQNISKTYHGKTILEPISLNVSPGKIYALAGDHDAGKTVLLNILAGLAPADSGTITLQGEPVFPGAGHLSRLVGYLPETYSFYPKMTVREYLDFFCHLYGIYGLKARKRCSVLLMQLQLTEYADSPIQELSASQKQTIQLIRAVLHDPHLLLFDCPRSSMDAGTRLVTQDYLTGLAQQGKIVFIATRTLSGPAAFADEIGYLQNGRLVLSGPFSVLNDAINSTLPLHVQVRDHPEDAYQILSTHPYVRRVTRDRLVFQLELVTDRGPDIRFSGGMEPLAPPDGLTVSGAEQQLLRDLVAHNISVTAFYRKKEDLDQLFVKLSEIRRIL